MAQPSIAVVTLKDRRSAQSVTRDRAKFDRWSAVPGSDRGMTDVCPGHHEGAEVAWTSQAVAPRWTPRSSLRRASSSASVSR